ncbi:alpha/beta hydrolase family protein [Salinicoccus luteus]|uniref:alpha/beta hydrolase family protein n=1 Tax=Salinicoccus luteus TaxID=367840 RepID=UPI0004E142F8|nr:prolyl oligopeptidase family serine peptidase [Salinicoccus luteus]
MEKFIKYMNIKYKREDQELYFISSESGMQQLWKYSPSKDRKVQLTKSDQNVKNYWLEKEHVTVAVDHHGNERNQFHVMDGDDMKPLVENPDYFHHYGEYDDGQNIYTMVRNHHESSSFDLCIVHGKGAFKVLETFDGPIRFIHELSPERVLLSKDVNNIDEALLIYDLDKRATEAVSLPEARFASFKFHDDRCLCLTDMDDGYMNVHEISLEDGSHKSLTSFQWDIEHFKVSWDRSEAILSCNENGYSILYRLDLKTFETKKLPGMQDGVVHSLDYGEGRELFLIHSSVDQPHHICRYSLETGKTETVLGNTSEASEVLWRMTSYRSFDDLEVPYFIYDSDSDEKRAVIHIHGGPESQARPEFNALYYHLNRAGIQVVVPNIRGSKGYGRAYLEADDKEKRLDAMEDVIALRRHLIDDGIAPESRISVMGRSYGGLMTLLLVTHHPELWASAVDIVGISHLRTFLEHTPPWRRTLRAAEYGSIEESGAFLDDISPLSRSGNISVPLMVFHSHHDARVPYSESVQMVEALKENGQYVGFTAYENEGHTYMHQENIDDMNSQIIEFLNRTL